MFRVVVLLLQGYLWWQAIGELQLFSGLYYILLSFSVPLSLSTWHGVDFFGFWCTCCIHAAGNSKRSISSQNLRPHQLQFPIACRPPHWASKFQFLSAQLFGLSAAKAGKGQMCQWWVRTPWLTAGGVSVYPQSFRLDCVPSIP